MSYKNHKVVGKMQNPPLFFAFFARFLILDNKNNHRFSGECPMQMDLWNWIRKVGYLPYSPSPALDHLLL